ncbi:MAG: hypothetical protein KC432_09670 [Thermomicrobiales bacterium]|nr:hypothetical protein [Thermomicrobiales bacterium]
MTTTRLRARDRAWVNLAAATALAGAMSLAVLGNAAAHAEHGHPARIHKGACESLQGVAYRLNGVGGSVDTEGAPVATPTAINPKTTYQVMVSDTVIDATIDDLLASDHAIMIYESDDAMEAIACGNVGGALSGDELIVGLGEARIPGHLGFALFTPDGDQTDVLVILGHAMAPVSASSGAANHEDEHDETDAHEASEPNHDEEAPHATPAP